MKGHLKFFSYLNILWNEDVYNYTLSLESFLFAFLSHVFPCCNQFKNIKITLSFSITKISWVYAMELLQKLVINLLLYHYHSLRRYRVIRSLVRQLNWINVFWTSMKIRVGIPAALVILIVVVQICKLVYLQGDGKQRELIFHKFMSHLTWCVQQCTTRKPVSNKGEGKDKILRLSSNIHMDHGTQMPVLINTKTYI